MERIAPGAYSLGYCEESPISDVCPAGKTSNQCAQPMGLWAMHRGTVKRVPFL